MRKYRVKCETVRVVEADSEDEAITEFEQSEAYTHDWPYEVEDLGEVEED